MWNWVLQRILKHSKDFDFFFSKLKPGLFLKYFGSCFWQDMLLNTEVVQAVRVLVKKIETNCKDSERWL